MIQFLLSILFLVSAQSAWGNDNVVPLRISENAPPLNSYIKYTKDYKGEITQAALLNPEIVFETIETPSIQFGFTKEKLLILFTVQNMSAEPGNWMLSTGRKSLSEFSLHEMSAAHATEILNSNDVQALNRNIRTYFRISHPFNLDAGEVRSFAISYNPEQNNFYLPLKVETTENFTQRHMWDNIIVFGSFTGILVLVIFNAGLYVVTGRRAFIWLSLAEFFFAFQALRTSGYFTYFFFLIDENYVHNRPYNELLGTFIKTMFIAFIILFAKSFIRTKQAYPVFDKFLSILAVLALVVLGLQAIDTFQGKDMNITLFKINWLLVLVTGLALPIVAIRATFDISKDFWPLIVAWVIFAVFVSYGVIITLNIFPSLPIATSFMGPVGLFETLFATLALVLHLRRINQEKLSSQIQLASALEANLYESEKARTLSEDKANALNVITNQSSLIHASGHDSKQVISALNAAVLLLEQNDTVKNRAQIKSIVESSSDYLKKIISSTISGANITIVHSDFTALSRFSCEDLFLPLEMLYRKQARNKGIKLKFAYSDQDNLASDLPILSRCLSNFLSNSMKFTENGLITVSGKRKNKTYIITIHDTGPGIDNETIQYLNSADITRLKPAYNTDGSGSGFLQSRSHIRKLGGQVNISNNAKTGTTVTIHLPAYETFTHCNLKALKSALPNYDIANIEVNGVAAKSGHPQTHRIAVTYDSSPMMREKIGETHRFVFYQPLYLEFADFIKSIENLNESKLDGLG